MLSITVVSRFVLLCLVPACLTMGACSCFAQGQQTGATTGATAGMARQNAGLIAVRVKPAEPTCIAATAAGSPDGELSSLPEIVFSRGSALICVRHADGRTEELKSRYSDGNFSRDGQEAAYWLPEKGELHVVSIATGSDELVEAIPGGKLQAMSWSGNGRKLAYSVNGATPEGIRVIDLDTGKRSISGVKFTGGSATLDPAYLLAPGIDGIHRIRLSDGHDDLVGAMPYAIRAGYSQSGNLLGILTVAPGEDEPPVADDDTPDCRGGSFALVVNEKRTGRMQQSLFPAGFNSVLDYEFSADDQTVAVTFGVDSCDYPGDSARVYMMPLATMALTPVSPAERLSVQAHWSPNGKIIVYQDYTGSDSPLMAFELATGKIVRLTNPGQMGPDNFLGWR